MVVLTQAGLLLALLVTCQAFNTLVPWDKEVTYEWNALVKAGTHFPASYVSQFSLHGTVHVQANQNATLVKISNIKHKLYTGVQDHVHEHQSHDIPLPPEVQDLEHVFKIVHDPNGLAIGIVTEKNEKEYTRNIKKAIATILQVHGTVVQHQTPHAFVTKEHSIYGYGEVDYNINPHGDEISVHKLHDMHHSGHLYHNFFTNTEPSHCDIGYEEVITHDSQKRYHIVKHEGHHIIKFIEADGGIFYFPHKAQSDAQYVLVNQTYQLLEVKPIQQQLQIQDEHFENHLTYHFHDSTNDESQPDHTLGRHVVNYPKVTPEILQMLEEIHQYLEQNHIHNHQPDTKHGQLINRVQRLLSQYNTHKLEELHTTLTQKSGTHHSEVIKVFHQILPLVGTKASTHLIKKLVVTKQVNDYDAVHMLQHFPENVVVPTHSLLTELEEIIDLDENNVPWDVRKVAILSFASLVYKTYKEDVKVQQNHEVHGDYNYNDKPTDDYHEASKYYEKYVVKFVNKIRSSQDFKLQQVYMHGLFNMKLPSIVHHMAPAVKGDWWHSHHLRLLALWSVAPALLADPDPNSIVELLWPIFTNRQEHTELRISAYYFIMESKPSAARLGNIYWYMLTEPNDELYHFHYTLVNTIKQSHEPCHRHFKVRLAQIMKFTHPPSHGTSSVQQVDYKDETFGFSGNLQTYFVNTNQSYLLTLQSYSQLFNHYVEDYVVYIKVHGAKVEDLDVVNWLKKGEGKIKSTQGKIHIEVSLIKHQHVMNSFYVDEHNLHEINSVIDFFSGTSKQSVTKNILHVSYNRFHKAVIPTDLGVPSHWEYLAPVVHKNDVSAQKEVQNNVLNVHISSKYVNWAHIRHGLSVYNPIANVWHGVNRYHAFDAVLPLNWDVTLNTQQKILQVSWKKQNDERSNIAGFRTHVKQMVFVKDDQHKNVLAQSSPNSKEFVIVSNGNEYRNDYTIVNHDDLTTGQNWHVTAYDCGHHVSNGSFKEMVHHFIQQKSKNFETPLSHAVASYAHAHSFMSLLPPAGVCGIMVKVQPSHEHAVSNIDLSVRANVETIGEDYAFAHGAKWNTRITYAVKNKEQTLKTWDVNAVLDMNPGHTVNNLKMHFTRIIPGQKDYKVCVEGVKKWTKKGVTGHLNVAMSQTPDGKCVKDDTVIDVTMTGERSQEQDHEHHKYGTCMYPIPHAVKPFHTINCLYSHTSLRHNVYNVKTSKVPTEFKKIVTDYWETLKGHYIDHYTYDDEHDQNMEDHKFKVDVVYPMQGHEIDIQVTTSQQIHNLTAIPTKYWHHLGIYPDTSTYSHWFVQLHDLGMVDHCDVHHDHHLHNHNYVKKTVPDEWTTYLADAVQNPQKAVLVKHVTEDKIAVKVIDHSHVFEIIPHDDTHEIHIDGQPVPVEEHHLEDWVAYHVFSHEVSHPVVAMFPQIGVHVEYDGHHASLIVPQEQPKWHGLCYKY